MSKLPIAEKTERAVIGTLLQFPNKLADCEKLGISEIHFHGAEQTIWQEIIRAEGEGRPFDYISLSDHLANTRNGDGPVLVALLGECMLDVAVPATLPDHCKTLISTHAKREALLLGNELAQAAKRAGDDYLEVIDKIRGHRANHCCRQGLAPNHFCHQTLRVATGYASRANRGNPASRRQARPGRW